MTEAFRFEDQVEAQGITHTVCGPKILVEYQPLDAEDDTLHVLSGPALSSAVSLATWMHF
jgi:hypothetical protein